MRPSLPAALLVGASIALLAACGEGTTPTTAPGSLTAPPVVTATPTAAASTSPGPDGFVTTPSGLKYMDIVVGTGPIPQRGQTVTLNYTGKLANGTVFDASSKHGGPFSYRHLVDGLIKGWDEGVSTMHVGGHRILVIPPNLGYGARGAPPAIPPNATLTFDIELLSAK